MAPMAHRDGVSNAGPIEENTIIRADGTTEEVAQPEPETRTPRKRAAKRASK